MPHYFKKEMIARWISIVDLYDFDIEHRRGVLHQNADGLSRIPVKRKCSNDKCPDCNFPDPDFGTDNLVSEVEAEMEEYPYPIHAEDTSEISNWVDIFLNRLKTGRMKTTTMAN